MFQIRGRRTVDGHLLAHLEITHELAHEVQSHALQSIRLIATQNVILMEMK